MRWIAYAQRCEGDFSRCELVGEGVRRYYELASLFNMIVLHLPAIVVMKLFGRPSILDLAVEAADNDL